MISPHTRAVLDSDASITLQASPYTYVRAIVMESALLKEQDYAKLLKMQLSEIIQFLEESTYKKEIDELAVSEQGIQLIEHAVHRNFRRAVEKLRRISDDNLRLLVDVYLWRNDIQNIKTLIRAKHSGEVASRVQNLFVPGTFTKDELLAIYNKSVAVEDVLKQTDLPFMRDALSVYTEGGLNAVESAMTKAYYEQTLQIAKRIKGEGETLREFLMLEVDAMNILTVLKLKEEGAGIEQIHNYLAMPKHTMGEQHIDDYRRRNLLNKLLHAHDVAECFAILEKTRFKGMLTRGHALYEKTGSLLDVERDLQSYVLRRATLLTHQHPLSVDVVLGYLFAKVIEIRNIFMLIKGKQLRVPEQFLEQELVIA
jgi:V/A-type H+/Na+-transporting ATPase subunit C